MRHTLKEAETFAGTLCGSKAADVITDLCDEVRRSKQKNRVLRHDAACAEQRADHAERRLREIESRGLLV